MALPTRPNFDSFDLEPTSDVEDVDVVESKNTLSENNVSDSLEEVALNSPTPPVAAKKLPTRPGLPTARPMAPTAAQGLQQDTPDFIEDILETQKTQKILDQKVNQTTQNSKRYFSKNRLTADDLMKNEYELTYAPLQEKVVSGRNWLQDLLQEKNRTEAVVDARRDQGEALDAMIREIEGHLTRHFASESIAKPQDIPILISLITNEIMGLGPIEPLWQDSSITEIMVNGPEEVYVERQGRLELVPGAQFRDQEHLLEIGQQILRTINKTIDVSNSYEDGRLVDGSRINITHQVIGPKGPFLTVRRFPEQAFSLEDLVNLNSMNEEIAEMLGNLVANGVSIIVVGGTGSGKTTILNALSGCIPRGERIVSIEDNLELQLHPEAHWLPHETRKSNQADGRGRVTIRDLVRNSLRQRPDRIVVGEVRDGSTYDMLQAMNTGHDGSLTTVHANDAAGGISRLANLMAEADVSTARAMALIAGGVDLLVVIDRFPEDGSRRIISVEEVPSLVESDGAVVKVTPIPLYQFQQTGTETIDGRQKAVGVYNQINELSDELIRKHRLNRKDHLTLEQIYKMSALPKKKKLPTSR